MANFRYHRRNGRSRDRSARSLTRGPDAEQMMREEAETLARAAGTFSFVVNKVDAQL
jgi:hypothetical protein